MEQALRSGTLTFLFTDVVDSTPLWDRFPRAMADALECHDRLLRATIAEHNGHIFAETGDGFGAAFTRAEDAVTAAIRAQEQLTVEPWPAETALRVRMGLHTGTAEQRGGNYFGTAVNRAARVSAAANGGQVLLSSATAALVADHGWIVRDIGEHRLKGLDRAERLHRVQTEGFPDVDLPARALRESVGNLPRRQIELIGRDRELAWLADAIAPGVLVTLTGPGGVGKTQLALAAGQAATSDADGAWFVPLAPALGAKDALAVTIDALGLFIVADPPDPNAIAEALGDQQRLVVLDNCEHVVGAVAALAGAILDRCPAVALVATSREALRCAGERVLRVPPLSIRADGEPSDAERLLRTRIDAFSGGPDPVDGDAAMMAEICRGLDGVPLALEIAAARVGTLGLEEVRDRLGRVASLDAANGGRQSSLARTVGWSYDLLSNDERRVFERLSVFPDGFDLAAATRVCDAPPLGGSVEAHLLSLIDKSLVVVQHARPMRYRLLEMVRQHAAEHLAVRGDVEGTTDRLVAHYLDWIADADAGARGPDELRWHRSFETEWNNLRAVMQHSVERGDVDTSCRIISHALWWASTRERTELGDWSESVLTLGGTATHPLLPIVLIASAWAARARSHQQRARQLRDAAVRAEHELEPANEPWVPYELNIHEMFILATTETPSGTDLLRRARGLPFWETVAAWRDAYVPAIMLANRAAHTGADLDLLGRVRRCVAPAEGSGNPTCIARAHNLLGVALRQVEPREAFALLESALALSESVGSKDSENRIDLAMHATDLGRAEEALALVADGIRWYLRAGAWASARAMSMGAFRALIALDRPQPAAMLLGLFRRFRLTDTWSEYVVPQRYVRRLEEQLPADELDRGMQRAASLSDIELSTEVLDAIEELLT